MAKSEAAAPSPPGPPPENATGVPICLTIIGTLFMLLGVGGMAYSFSDETMSLSHGSGSGSGSGFSGEYEGKDYLNPDVGSDNPLKGFEGENFTSSVSEETGSASLLLTASPKPLGNFARQRQSKYKVPRQKIDHSKKKHNSAKLDRGLDWVPAKRYQEDEEEEEEGEQEENGEEEDEDEEEDENRDEDADADEEEDEDEDEDEEEDGEDEENELDRVTKSPSNKHTTRATYKYKRVPVSRHPPLPIKRKAFQQPHDKSEKKPILSRKKSNPIQHRKKSEPTVDRKHGKPIVQVRSMPKRPALQPKESKLVTPTSKHKSIPDQGVKKKPIQRKATIRSKDAAKSKKHDLHDSDDYDYVTDDDRRKVDKGHRRLDELLAGMTDLYDSGDKLDSFGEKRGEAFYDYNPDEDELLTPAPSDKKSHKENGVRRRVKKPLILK